VDECKPLTAGRPYRTIQKCIDASLGGARDFYVYKKADGGRASASFAVLQGTSNGGQRVSNSRPR